MNSNKDLTNIVLIFIYRSEFDYYETTQSNFLPPHLQSCIQYKRMNYSATRPSSSVRSRSQSEMRLPDLYVD
jgi:hypothetical protein